MVCVIEESISETYRQSLNQEDWEIVTPLLQAYSIQLPEINARTLQESLERRDLSAWTGIERYIGKTPVLNDTPWNSYYSRVYPGKSEK